MTSTTLNRIFVTFLLILATSSLGSGQATKPLTSQESSTGTPGGIQLLEGYRHTKLRGIDTSVGTISKPGGLTIDYDIGVLAGKEGLQCFAKDWCLWFKRQITNGAEVWIGVTKTQDIIATFPTDYANFYAHIKSPEDIADFLIMILTYKATRGGKVLTNRQFQRNLVRGPGHRSGVDRTIKN
jgi:hypothetical protein